MGMGNETGAMFVYYRDILRFVRRRVDSRTEAEDITQEVFATAAQTLARASPSSPPTLAWLYTVARRRLADEARRRRLKTVPLELVDGSHASRSDEYGPEVGHVLEAAIASLSEVQRRVVLLRLIRGRTFAEIALTLGVTEAACRMRFMRGLEHLRNELEKEGLRP